MTKPTAEQTTPECRQALVELFTYLDGEIGPVERDEVAHHLDRCSDCLEAFEFHHELRQLIAQRCRTEAPEQLKARILSALNEATVDPSVG
jgi:mycothiol system anti-sigma-R factor